MSPTFLMFRNNLKKIILNIILLSIIILFLLIIMDFFAYSHFYKFKYLKTNDEYAIFYNGNILDNNSFIYCDNDILCYPEEVNYPINIEIIMQKKIFNNSNNYITKMYKDKLNENEIIIPETVAKNYNLKVGDSLNLDLGYSLENKKYFIKKIINNIPSLSNDSNRFISVIGYSPIYCDHINYKTVLFYNGSIQNITLHNYIKKIDLKTLAIDELFLFLFYFFFYLIVLIGSIFLILVNQMKNLNIKYAKLRSMGYSNFKVILSNLILTFLILLPIILIPLIFMVLFKSCVLFSIVNSLIFLLIIISVFVFKYKENKGEYNVNIKD